MSTTRKSTRVWIAGGAAAVAAVALTLAPFAALAPSASAASFVNTTVPSNVNLGVVGGNYYGGSLDDLRLYNRALSSAEVTRLYHLGS